MLTLKDIDDYQNRLTEEQKKLLLRHCNTYDIKPEICAWYDDWNDFCSDWCDDIGYTKTEAREFLRDSQFITFEDGSIVRLVV